MTPPLAALEERYGQGSDALILEALLRLDRETHVVTEGSSEDALVQDIATKLGFRSVHFSPRGGGLGWAMPLGVGISLASGKPSVCFVGDGGSLFSIHAIWTAARYRIPVVFVCFVNHEYRILKDLWCHAMGTAFQDTRFVGLDFRDPQVDVVAMSAALGARTEKLSERSGVSEALGRALEYAGPSFLVIER